MSKNKWYDGFIWAEGMVEEYGYKGTAAYFEINMWCEEDLDEFDRGCQDYLSNYKYRMGK